MSRLIGIHFDEEEFNKMAKGRLKKEFGKYMRHGTIPIDIRGKDIVTIPVLWFETPSFRYGFPNTGVGQGEGEPGQDLGPVGDDDEGDEPGQKPSAGKGGGGVTVGVKVTLEEFAEFFQEALELPHIQPKGERCIMEEKDKYNTIARVGPMSQLHVTRTFEEAVQEAIAMGTYQPPEKTIIVPNPKNFRFRSFNRIKEPRNNAVVFYMRDISGSMNYEQIRVCQYLCGFCSFWLSRYYHELEEVWVVHHGEAWEVKKDEFFKIQGSGGGTECSTAHVEADKIIDKRYPPSEWNIYIVYLSDGFNFGTDNDQYIAIVKKLLPVLNMYNYGEVSYMRSWWGAYKKSGASIFSEPGTIGHILEKEFKNTENVALAEIESDPSEAYESAIEAIKKFFKSEK